MRKNIYCALIAMAFTCAVAQAGVTPYSNHQDWLDAIAGSGDPGAVTTIDFTGFTHGTIITNQYEDEGVTFFGGIDTIYHNVNVFPNDDWGLDGNGDINMTFERPIHWIAVEWPGASLNLELYSKGNLLFNAQFGSGPPIGHFSGLYSSEAFDSVIIVDPKGEAAIDDLHFVIPSPSPIVPLFITLLYGSRSCRNRKVTGTRVRHLKKET